MRAFASAVSYSVLLSPMVMIGVAMAGTVAALRWRRVGFAATMVPLIVLYVASTPFLADAANACLDDAPMGRTDPARAGAIVVLGGDGERVADGEVRLGPISLRRVMLAASAYRRTGLPILASGGALAKGDISVADLMSDVLQRDFAVPVRWRETRSRNTYENAAFTAAILKAAGIETILLASQPRDVPRAVWSFNRFGIAVEPVASAAPILASGDVSDFLPSPKALLSTYYAAHELLGLIYYRLVYG